MLNWWDISEQMLLFEQGKQISFTFGFPTFLFYDIKIVSNHDLLYTQQHYGNVSFYERKVTYRGSSSTDWYTVDLSNDVSSGTGKLPKKL